MVSLILGVLIDPGILMIGLKAFQDLKGELDGVGKRREREDRE